MDKSRILIILILIVIALLFAVGVGAGFLRKDDGSAPKDETGIKAALQEVPELITGLGGLLDGMGAKLKAEDLTDVQGQPLVQPLVIQPGIALVTHVRASEGDDYRKAVFRVIGPNDASVVVEVRYQADCLPPKVANSNSAKDMRDQKLKLINAGMLLQKENECKEEDKACRKLTVFKCGGTLTLTCSGPSPCRVELR
jgi:hypothetical protein